MNVRTVIYPELQRDSTVQEVKTMDWKRNKKSSLMSEEYKIIFTYRVFHLTLKLLVIVINMCPFTFPPLKTLQTVSGFATQKGKHDLRLNLALQV